ncbi:glutamine synthetase III [Neobittarella massiliensis]|uniref:Glutamine synthetase III n=1 Tax=Neobittarella massiliensis (ex Bilen et al. 2018) TaxID=2041842 RepID=A0A8J6INF8_9FIRM|nr:glutamine synthetase III [Neobittarella massiliensis]MBC3515121.1 glutamine synthetase III [Neobittarella massiliensis]
MRNDQPSAYPIDFFGENVFDDETMQRYIPFESYRQLKEVIEQGGQLHSSLADVVAEGMKEWAIAKGATHYTHWFQPLNGFTAEKHESFISPTEGGGVITAFSGKMLIKGESDASSFPSGGLRATFEARGYTMWDCTSPVFLKEDKSGVTLCIPTAFCSYTGEALDEKTPLLRSLVAVDEQARKVLTLFGHLDTRRVSPSVGAEQEYFLIDRSHLKKRLDLKFTGRTLFGARPPKCQELEDHYYGNLNEKISSFMKELDYELWKVGVTAKTKHNEAAPSQHELAPVFSAVNIAADQNQIIMETLHKVAARHDLCCLLHEKPFDYINGSGKHNNWSLSTDDGQNLFEPGNTPYENMQFLLMLSAVIKAVDEYSGLLRLATASYTNDCRLGGYEAPPAIISMFLGSDIQRILETIASGDQKPEGYQRKVMDMGVGTLPKLHVDSSDRNRTSPFAFTGNKFEFRMLGSSMSISWVNTVLNTITADVLSEIYDRLRACRDFDLEVNAIIREIYQDHGRIIFNGNGYAGDWESEARRRGLPVVPDTVSAAEVLKSSAVIDMFAKFSVHSKEELMARYEIILETYSKKAAIEAKTMLTMCRRQILPAVRAYLAQQSRQLADTQSAGLDVDYLRVHVDEIAALVRSLIAQTDALAAVTAGIGDYCDPATATYCRDALLPAMRQLRHTADCLEEKVDARFWPIPTYDEILFDEQG